MRALFPSVALVVTLALAACGDEDFETSDPNGWKACQTMIQAYQSSDPTIRIGSILEEGKLALTAESDDIKAAAKQLAGTSAMADPGKLEAACEAHGMTIPNRVPVNGADATP